MSDTGMMIVAQGVTKEFGGVIAINDVSFQIRKGEIYSIIGPNGAGKTTLLNMMSGFLPITKGEILLNGERISGLKPYQIAKKGITRTFQNLEVFHNMNVIENVLTGAHLRMKTGFMAAGLRLPFVKREERDMMSWALECLEMVGIKELAAERADTLPYGNQRLLEIARAAASKPEMILLDEPMAGLNPQESRVLVETILKMRQNGMTFVLVEHDIETVMAISDSILVLDNGKKIGEGTPDEIYQNQEVIAAYLGEDEEDTVPC